VKEIALHIQDIAENSIRAGATQLRIHIVEDTERDVLSVHIADNGCGMDEMMLKKALDPFFTTKNVRRVGMGLSLFRQAALRADGSFSIESAPGKGTSLTAEFRHSHFDRQPLGDMAGAIVVLLMSDPELDIDYRHRIDEDEFVFDTKVIRSTLEDVTISEPAVLQFIRELISDRQNLE